MFKSKSTGGSKSGSGLPSFKSLFFKKSPTTASSEKTAPASEPPKRGQVAPNAAGTPRHEIEIQDVVVKGSSVDAGTALPHTDNRLAEEDEATNVPSTPSKALKNLANALRKDLGRAKDRVKDDSCTIMKHISFFP